MKRFLALAFLLVGSPAFGQSSTLTMAKAVTACGSQSLTNGNTYPVTQDLTGKLCDSAGGGGGGSVTQGTVPWVVSNAGTFAVQATLGAETTKVIGTVNQGTSPWVTSGTSTVSGTVSATQGTSPWVVSNGGTFATQATLAAETTKVIGTVNQGTSPWVVSGSLTANQSVNVAQIAGTTTATGSGVLGAGTQRIALATDSPGIVTLGQTTKSASVPMAIASDQVGTAGTANATVFTVQGVASMTKLLVTPDSVALPANQSVNVAQINGVTPLMGNGATGTGSHRVTIASDNTAFGVIPTVTTSGGMTSFFVQPAASDNHTVVKAGAGQVYYVLAMNNSATVNYLRFYDATTGFNGCNSASNLITQIQIPASTSVGGISIPLPFGLPFATGISICVTSAYATNDTTNATASAMSLTIGYK